MRQDKQVNQKSSIYIIPFYKENMDKYVEYLKNPKDGDWLYKEGSKTRYLSRYVTSIYGGENDSLPLVYLQDAGRTKHGIPARGQKVRLYGYVPQTGEFIFDFEIYTIRVFCFKTGIGVLCLQINYEDDADWTKIADFNASFSRFMNLDEKGYGIPKFSLIQDDEETPINLAGNIASLADMKLEDVCLFPSFAYRKCYMYHSFVAEQSPEKLKMDMDRLVNGLYSNAQSWNGSDDYNKFYTVSEGISWNISPLGACTMADKKLKFASRHQHSAMMDYLTLYILAVQEREALLRYHNEVVKNCDDMRTLTAMREELMRFSIQYGHNTVSNETNYQMFFKNITDIMQISEMVEDIQEATEKVDDYAKSQKENHMNILLGAIGVLAIFSALIDGADFVKRIYDNDMAGGGYIFVFAVIIIAVVYGLGGIFGVNAKIAAAVQKIFKSRKL